MRYSGFKKLFSLLLVFTLQLGMFSVNVYAEENEGEPIPTTQETDSVSENSSVSENEPESEDENEVSEEIAETEKESEDEVVAEEQEEETLNELSEELVYSTLSETDATPTNEVTRLSVISNWNDFISALNVLESYANSYVVLNPDEDAGKS